MNYWEKLYVKENTVWRNEVVKKFFYFSFFFSYLLLNANFVNK